MNTSQELPDLSHSPLNPADRALLAQAILDGFSLPMLLSRAPDAHPAQRCILALLEWFDLPHIKAAADRHIQTVERLNQYSAHASVRPIRERLLQLFGLAFDNAAEGRNTIRPESAPSAQKHHTAACREARLVMLQFMRLSFTRSARKNPTDSPRHPSPDPADSSHPESLADLRAFSSLKSQFESLFTSPIAPSTQPPSIADLFRSSPQGGTTGASPAGDSPIASNPAATPPTSRSATDLHHAAGTAAALRSTSTPAAPSRPLPLHMNLLAAPGAALDTPLSRLLHVSNSPHAQPAT